jgi:hypothetical protein
MYAVELLRHNGRRRFAVRGPVDALKCYGISVRIGSRNVPRQDTASLTKATYCLLGAKLVQRGSVFVRGFAILYNGKVGKRNHRVNVLAHVAVGTVAVQSIDCIGIASKPTLYLSAMTASDEFFLFGFIRRRRHGAGAVKTQKKIRSFVIFDRKNERVLVPGL